MSGVHGDFWARLSSEVARVCRPYVGTSNTARSRAQMEAGANEALARCIAETGTLVLTKSEWKKDVVVVAPFTADHEFISVPPATLEIRVSAMPDPRNVEIYCLLVADA